MPQARNIAPCRYKCPVRRLATFIRYRSTFVYAAAGAFTSGPGESM